MKAPLKCLMVVITACALWGASLAAQSVKPGQSGQAAQPAQTAQPASPAPAAPSSQTSQASPSSPSGATAQASQAAQPGRSGSTPQPSGLPSALEARNGANSAKANARPAIPAGTTLRVTLDTTLTDKTNKSGDAFTGEISSPVYINGKDVIPQYSTVNGHIAFLKPSGRVAGKAQMRLVLDNITTPDGLVYPLAGTLEEAQGGVCAHTAETGKTKADEEGTITGCGKSKKKAAEAAAIVGGMGAGVGASIGMGKEIECDWYGYCPPGGSGIGTDIMYGAGIGAGTALIYTLFKHERHIVLVQGSVLTFTVDRTTMAERAPAPSASAGSAE